MKTKVIYFNFISKNNKCSWQNQKTMCSKPRRRQIMAGNCVPRGDTKLPQKKFLALNYFQSENEEWPEIERLDSSHT